MARYTGPKHKLARREGINILDKSSASLMRRLNTPPGVHAGKKGRRRPSEYGMQLREKQKAKVMYGLFEKQFKQLVQKVTEQVGDTEELLLSTLERRLDNIVYRLGFSKSRMMARQIVVHGHVLVNNKKMTIPSYTVNESDTVSISETMQKNPDIKKLFEEKIETLPFLERKGPVGRLKRMPKAEDIMTPFSTRQIIEYYSR
ncbi:MAG TPA: 30S ribosomal protein S4 [Candidatus Saccharimonadales bacterium]|nr:30S ribosomal protein S4 [Candidatus Saccharimonadales bacterium]